MKIACNRIYLCFIFIVISCSNNKNIPKLETSNSNSFSYLALGDSYTIGESVSYIDNWPNQFIKKLEEKNITISSTKIIAKTGWTTNDLLNAIAIEKPKKYNIVSLLIGVNNQYQKLPFDLFETEFDSLLTIAKNLAIKKVFVVSIPDYGYTPFGENNKEQITLEINRYNAYMQKKCASENISFINITNLSRELSENERALAFDGLHPSSFQYGKWVEKILSKISF